MLNNIASMLGVGGAAIGDYESIATVSVGAGGTSAVEFTTIAGTYSHLQIRGIAKGGEATFSQFKINTRRFNKFFNEIIRKGLQWFRFDTVSRETYKYKIK